MRLVLLLPFSCFAVLHAASMDAALHVKNQPVAIATVTTLKDLLDQKKITVRHPSTSHQVEVRLGIEADRAPAGSGVLVYAICDRGETLNDTIEDLGPVMVKVQREGGMKILEEMVRKERPPSLAAPLYFFAKAIPLREVGRYHVRVLESRTNRLLAETQIQAFEDSRNVAPAWHELQQSSNEPVRLTEDDPSVGRFQIGQRAIPKVEGDNPLPLRQASEAGRVEGAEKMALPKLLPSQPADATAASSPEEERRIDSLVSQLGHESFDVRMASTRELARLGRRAKPALKKAQTAHDDPEIRARAYALLRKLDGPFTAKMIRGRIVISMADRVFDPRSLAQHLLARWWINGNAVLVKLKPLRMVERTGLVRLRNEAAFSIDLSGLGVHPKDTVTVEFLYCPNGIMLADKHERMMTLAMEELAKPDGADPFFNLRSLRSNRITFNASEVE